MTGDAATNFGVVLSGVAWDRTGAVPIARSAVNVPMEGTPEGVEFSEVEC